MERVTIRGSARPGNQFPNGTVLDQLDHCQAKESCASYRATLVRAQLDKLTNLYIRKTMRCDATVSLVCAVKWTVVYSIYVACAYVCIGNKFGALFYNFLTVK